MSPFQVRIDYGPVPRLFVTGQIVRDGLNADPREFADPLRNRVESERQDRKTSMGMSTMHHSMGSFAAKQGRLQ
jgi:hypothetical protein